MPDDKEIRKAHCNRCHNETDHALLCEERTTWNEVFDEHFSIDGGDNYEMLKCRGCHAVKMRHKSWFSEECDSDGRPIVNTTYYPPAISRRKPDWISKIRAPGDFTPDHPIEDLMHEIYAALQNDSRRLATMGVRSLLEHMMVKECDDHGNFPANVAAFFEAGYISAIQRKSLDIIIDVGNAAIHRAFKPSPDELQTLFDIAESVVASTYIHQRPAEALQQRVPPRNKK